MLQHEKNNLPSRRRDWTAAVPVSLHPSIHPSLPPFLPAFSFMFYQHSRVVTAPQQVKYPSALLLPAPEMRV